jgi:hypothetical protein
MTAKEPMATGLAAGEGAQDDHVGDEHRDREPRGGPQHRRLQSPMGPAG